MNPPECRCGWPNLDDDDLGHCFMCCAPIPVEDFLNHIRVTHPAVFDDLQRWPDGQLVIHDADPHPNDITGDAA